MTLTASSALFYWSARDGVVPVVGESPTFSRSTAGTVLDVRGRPMSALLNRPRFSWETDKSTVNNERRAALLLEMAHTNALVAPSDFSNAAWTKTNVSVTTGVTDPMGGTSACTLTATANAATVTQALAAGASMQRSNTIWMRRRSGVGVVGVRRFDASVFDVVTLTSAWTRVSPTLAAASTSRQFGIYLDISGDAVDVWSAQQDDSPFPTSGIFAGGTRAADSLSYPALFPPQAMMLHVRFVERGTLLAGGRVVEFSSSGDADPRLLVYVSGGMYVVSYANSAVVSSVLTVAPSLGDTVDLIAVLLLTGQVQIIQSINGGAVTSGVLSGALTLPANWSGAQLWFNSVGSTVVGCNAFMDVRAVKYADVVASTAQGIMDELKTFRLNSAGELL